MAATFDPGDKMRRIGRNLVNPKAALKQIGAMMVAESQRAFKVQKRGKHKWAARAPINVYGIIADFHQGKRTPPNRRFESRPVLRDTGRLAASISFQLRGRMVVEAGTNLGYANTLHRGGKIASKPITAQVKDLLGRWLKGKGSEYAGRLGFLLNKRDGEVLTGKVEARPIVAITKSLREDVKEAVGVKIMEVD